MRYLLVGALLVCATAVVADEPETLYRITGQVVDEDDRPVADAKVGSLSQWQQAVSTADDGRFVLRVPHQRYDLLLVRATDADGARQAFAGFAVGEQDKTMLSRFLPDGKTELPEQLRLVVRPAKKVEVVVVDGEQRAPLIKQNADRCKRRVSLQSFHGGNAFVRVRRGRSVCGQCARDG